MELEAAKVAEQTEAEAEDEPVMLYHVKSLIKGTL
jgi:hypothetical protein